MTEGGALLLLEPDIIARQPLADYLRDCGFRVFEAATPDEARRLLEAEAVSVDLVLADAGGDAAGMFALSQWIRESRAGLAIILAGTIEKTVAEAGSLCNDGPALAKPYDHKRVLQHIKAAFAKRQTKS